MSMVVSRGLYATKCLEALRFASERTSTRASLRTVTVGLGRWADAILGTPWGTLSAGHGTMKASFWNPVRHMDLTPPPASVELLDQLLQRRRGIGVFASEM